jgi:hypothetical protein
VTDANDDRHSAAETARLDQLRAERDELARQAAAELDRLSPEAREALWDSLDDRSRAAASAAVVFRAFADHNAAAIAHLDPDDVAADDEDDSGWSL